ESALGSNLAGDAGDFGGERTKLLDHRVDRLLELKNFAAYVHRDLAREVAARDGDGHLGDVADLAGQVGGHRVDVVGQILPRASHTRHGRLAVEDAFAADLACDACDFGSESVELVHHRVDRVLEFQNFAAHVHGDFARQVAA